MVAVDTARTLVLPDLTLPSVALLSTLALYWDTIDLVVDPEGTPNPSDSEQEAIYALHDAGVLRVSLIRTLPETHAAWEEEARQIASVWEQTSPDTTAATLPRELAEQIVVARARRVAQTVKARVEFGMDLARERWAAPTAPSLFSLMASALPDVQAQLPVAEATLINIAIRGAAVDPSTPLEAVLEFREKNTELAGRLRAALGDVADSIRVDLPMSAVVGQAEAAIKNRVEPALGALETELQRGRISFVWSNVLGLGGIAATAMHPTATTLGTGAQLVGRGLRYAFDRDALVRDHSFGYLHRVRTTFGEDSATGPGLDSVAAPMTAPRMELETLLGKMYVAAFGVGDDSFNRMMIGERGTDPREVFESWDRATHGRHEDDPPNWWMQTQREDLRARLKPE